MAFMMGAPISRAQQAGAMTAQEEAVERRIRPVLHFALDTLSREHTLGEAVSYIRAYASTDKDLVADLTALSKTEQEGIRNLSLWCIEAAYPDDSAAWKAILRDGKVVSRAYVKESAEQIAGFIRLGVLDWNSVRDAHAIDDETKPAMKVAEFKSLYGEPDRRATIQGTEVGGNKSHKWLFYGPLGVKVDDAETVVFQGQLSMAFFLWIAAMKSYDVEFSSPSDFVGMHAQTKERIPDMHHLFLEIGSTPSLLARAKSAGMKSRWLARPYGLALWIGMGLLLALAWLAFSRKPRSTSLK
jgi:hypothetical protein